MMWFLWHKSHQNDLLIKNRQNSSVTSSKSRPGDGAWQAKGADHQA